MSKFTDDTEDEENDEQDEQEQQDEASQADGFNMSNVAQKKDAIQDAGNKVKTAQKVEKGAKVAKAGATAAKAGATAAKASKAIALLANPVVWIVIAIILIVIAVVGIIMSFTIMPGNFIGKLKNAVNNIMTTFCGFIWGDNTSPISDKDDKVIELANYIQSMGYDVQGFGFGDVVYDEDTNKDVEAAKADYESKDINGVDQFESPAIAPGSGNIKEVNGITATMSTPSADAYREGNEMFRIAGRFSTKNSDYLRAYLSAAGATYTESTVSLKGILNNLGDWIGDTFEKLKNSVFHIDAGKVIEDPGSIGVKTHSTGMLNFLNTSGDNFFNKTLSGSNARVKVDPKKRQLLLFEKGVSLGVAKIQWGQTFSVDLSNWTAIYGRPLELFLALHLSTMMPDLPYQIAVDQAFNTKVNIGLQDTKVSFNTNIKINDEPVTIGETEIDQDDETNNKVYKEQNLDTLVNKFLDEQVQTASGNKTSAWSFFKSTVLDSQELKNALGDDYMIYKRCIMEAFEDQLEVDTVWLGNKDKINYRSAMLKAGEYFADRQIDKTKDYVENTISDILREAAKGILDGAVNSVKVITDFTGWAAELLANIYYILGNANGWLADHLELSIPVGSGWLSKVMNTILPAYDENNKKLISFKYNKTDGPTTKEKNDNNGNGDTSDDEDQCIYDDETVNAGGSIVFNVFAGLQDLDNAVGGAIEDSFFVRIDMDDDQDSLTLLSDGGSSVTANFTDAQVQNLCKLVAAGLGETSLKFPYIESVTNHWYYHIIDFIGTVGTDTQYGAYKKAKVAKKTIKYNDEKSTLTDYDISLTALFTSNNGIFYQVCEPYLNDDPSLYTKLIFSGFYYKYDGTEDTAKRIAAARAIEAHYYNKDTNRTECPGTADEIVADNITYCWHGDKDVKVTSEQADEFIHAKMAEEELIEKTEKETIIDEDKLRADLKENNLAAQDWNNGRKSQLSGGSQNRGGTNSNVQNLPPNAQKVYDFLYSKGLGDVQIAAILGNAYRECGGVTNGDWNAQKKQLDAGEDLKPGTRGPNGDASIAGYIGKWQQNLKEYAAVCGEDWKDATTQAEYLFYTLHGDYMEQCKTDKGQAAYSKIVEFTKYAYPGTYKTGAMWYSSNSAYSWDNFISSTDAGSAAYIYFISYEGMSGHEDQLFQCQSCAQYWYDKFVSSGSQNTSNQNTQTDDSKQTEDDDINNQDINITGKPGTDFTSTPTGDPDEESPMCKRPVEFQSNKQNSLSAFSILEHVNSEEADVNYRLLKKLMVQMDYFSEEEMDQKEKNILLWITNVPNQRGQDIAETIERNRGNVDEGHQALSETGRDTNDFGIVVTNFMSNTTIVAPGDAKVKSTGTDSEKGDYIELSFTSLDGEKVYPVKHQMMLLNQDDESNVNYNKETEYLGGPLYSAATVMRKYRFKDTYQVFDDDDMVGITMKIYGLKGIKVSAGGTTTRGQVIAENPSKDDKIYVEMKKADKTKVDNIEDYIKPEYTLEDEKIMARELWYSEHLEKGERYMAQLGGNNYAASVDYVQWAMDTANDPRVGYSQDHRLYTDNGNGVMDVDCSSFVFYALKNNGYDVEKYCPGWPFTTDNEPGVLKSLGFQELPFTSVSDCQEGDILWRDGHTEIYVGNGQSCGAHSAHGHPEGGDKEGNEVSTVPCSTNWTRIYRPPR